MVSTDNDGPARTPPPFTPALYLCQVGDAVSCGACCGLYNVARLCRKTLTDLLGQRTAAFSQVPRTVAGIDAFAERCAGFDPPKQPFPGFHHCPFVGLIDGGRRVGCLLHPMAAGNAGVDFRGLSYYGGLACATYFCPTSRLLPAAHLAVLRSAFERWYDYGLLVTERRLLTEVFQTAERRIGRPLADADPAQIAAVAGLLRALSAVHARWPYRRSAAPGPCNYFFENGEYPRPPVVRERPDIPPSRYEAIFLELESGFATKEVQSRAERLLDRLFGRLSRQAGDSR